MTGWAAISSTLYVLALALGMAALAIYCDGRTARETGRALIVGGVALILLGTGMWFAR